MSADAASLLCPICLHSGAFSSAQSLRDRLINVSTNNILCPVCQEEVSGLDKLTIHLFSHVKLLTAKRCPGNDANRNIKIKPETENQTRGVAQQKKSRSSGAKNKTSASTANVPVKFVKIYPKLPVLSLNTVPIIDISRGPNENTQASNSVHKSGTQTESSIIQTNTTCNVCGLQFVDANILKMHKCLIHNIEEDSSQNFTRYHCHLCPKNFKMRGSLMVHLRVAHYGFLSGGCKLDSNRDKELEEKSPEQVGEDKLANVERNDNKHWQCDVCRKCFTTKYFLKKHKRLHTGETPYACTQCNKTFTFQQSYHKHLLYHNDEKPHTCNYCGRAFKELSTLHNHQRIHTGEKPFSCETCGKCFRQRVSYLVHRRIHTGVMPYKCTACDKSFRYKVSQRTHKCLAQPPGTVVRQTGDLVEKLKKKYVDSGNTITKFRDDASLNMRYLEVSEANAELVRSGAKLSLQDTETEHFTLIDEAFNKNNIDQIDNSGCIPKSILHNEKGIEKNDEMFDSNIEELIDSIPVIDKNIPSPSEILKNLCLSTDEDYIGIREDLENVNNYNMYF